jgi:hypothetical protein
MNKYAVMGMCLFLASCKLCKPYEFEVVDISNKKDVKKTCKAIDLEISTVELKYRSVKEKHEDLEAYAENPVCLYQVDISAIRAKRAYKDRIDYLHKLKELKDCDGKIPDKKEKEVEIIETKIPQN